MKIRFIFIGFTIMLFGIFSFGLWTADEAFADQSIADHKNMMGGLPVETSERKAADANLQSQIDALLEKVSFMEGQINGCIPTGEDIPCDGIDQDCDGSDNTSVSPSILTFVPDNPFIVNFCDYSSIEILYVKINLNGCINDVSPGSIVIHYKTTGASTTVDSIYDFWDYWMYMDMDVDIGDDGGPVRYRVTAVYNFDITSNEVYVDVSVQDYPWNLARTWKSDGIDCIWFYDNIVYNYREERFSLLVE